VFVVVAYFCAPPTFSTAMFVSLPVPLMIGLWSALGVPRLARFSIRVGLGAMLVAFSFVVLVNISDWARMKAYQNAPQSIERLINATVSSYVLLIIYTLLVYWFARTYWRQRHPDSTSTAS
jgi:hypothetical protein